MSEIILISSNRAEANFTVMKFIANTGGGYIAGIGVTEAFKGIFIKDNGDWKLLEMINTTPDYT